VDIREFIEARLVEKEHQATSTILVHRLTGGFSPMGTQILAEVKAIREILALHEQWIVALQTPIRINGSEMYDPLSSDSYILKASSEIKFMTEKAYRAQFGTEPPTTPMIRAIAAIWSTHDDYQEAWG